jgi:hypothetical protein
MTTWTELLERSRALRQADPRTRGLTLAERVALLTPEELAERDLITAAIIDVIREKRAALNANTAAESKEEAA